MTTNDMRTHLSWTERIHDNLTSKLAAAGSGLVPTITACVAKPSTVLNLLPGATILGANVDISIVPRGTGAFELDI